MAPRRRIRRNRRPRMRRPLLPFEATFTYNQSTPAIVNLTSGDFSLPPNRPLGIVRYVITAASDDATAMQVTLFNGLETITMPTLTIGQSRCRFSGRMPVILPRAYTTTTIQIMRLNFAGKINSTAVFSIRLYCRMYGVEVKSFMTVGDDGFLKPLPNNGSDTDSTFSMPDAERINI